MIAFEFDGRQIAARDGETIAAALVRNDVRAFHRSRTGAPRGLFCGIGACHECHAVVDGRRAVRTCMVVAREGMQVSSR